MRSGDFKTSTRMIKRKVPERLRNHTTHDFGDCQREVLKFSQPAVDVVSYRWYCKRCGIAAVENVVGKDSYCSYEYNLLYPKCDEVVMKEALE